MSAGLGAYGLGFSEDALVEQPAIELFRQLGWEAGDPFDAVWGPRGSLGRESDHEVVLLARLRPALERLNPDLPADALDATIEELSRDRSALSDVAANQDVYRLIKDGVKVKTRDERGREEDVSVRVIDWREVEARVRCLELDEHELGRVGRWRTPTLARQLFGPDAPFATLVKGGRKLIDRNHAVLLLRLGDLVIADWSHNGRCAIWREGDRKAPSLLKGRYTSDDVDWSCADHSWVHAGADNYTWQNRVRRFIAGETNLVLHQREFSIG